MNPLSEYTGLAYCFETRNCWHHVINVRKDFGLDTPDFDCTSPELSNETFEAAHSNTKGLEQSSEPDDLCAVLMLSDGRWHSGVYLDGDVSHCDRNARQVRLDSLESLQRVCERIEFWR
jgi:hypothetical protein